MKKSKFIIPILFSLSLTGCIFDFAFNTTTLDSITVDVDQKTRIEGDTFDLDDVTFYLSYSNNTRKRISYDQLNEYDLVCYFFYPGYDINSVSYKRISPTEDFIMDEVGKWTVYVTGSPFDNPISATISEDYFTVDKKLIPAESLSISESSISLEQGESYQLEAFISPINTTSELHWSSNDTSIAYVSEEGLVEAIGIGQCTVRATIDSLCKECIVTVNPNSNIVYEFTSVSYPNLKSPNGNWTVSNRNISMSSQYGLNITGSTTISSIESYESISKISFNCGVTSGLSATLSINILDNDNNVTYNTSLKIKENYMLDYDVPINDLTGKISVSISLSSSGYFYRGNFYIKSISVTNNDNPIYASSIAIDGDSSIAIAEEKKLNIIYDPVSCNNRNVTWSSSDENIISISQDGTILGINEGSATIEAKVKVLDGYVSASKDITVYSIPLERIDLASNKMDIYLNATKKISYSIYPNNASYIDVTFSSSNPNIATVDASGNIKGISIGKCLITVASSKYPSISSTIEVSVLEMANLAPLDLKYTTKDYINNNYYRMDSAPTIGELKLLVIPIWFTDSSTFIKNDTYKSYVRQDIESAYFGTQEDTGWNSCKTYYETLSDNKLTLTGTVSEWYSCNQSISKFNYSSSSKTNPDPTSSLVKTATDWYFSTHTSDSRTNYDADKNGFIDGVILIYGSADYSAAERYYSLQSNLWAYTYWLQNNSYCNTSAPGPNVFFWASYDFMYSSGNSASRRSGSIFGSGDASRTSIDTHTYIHEMGHLFGLEDYYDYTESYIPAGGFSMQDHNSGSHDPYSVLAFGWGKAYLPTESCELTLNAFQKDHSMIILTPQFNSHMSPFDEYLILELYTPTGLNESDCKFKYGSSLQGVTDVGIRLWHVDARVVKLDSFGVAHEEDIYDYPVDDCYHAMSNSYYSRSISRYSILGQEYADYNILQLIRNDEFDTYRPTDNFSSSSLFKTGDSFDMTTFRRQFVNSGKLNKGIDLGWEFTVKINSNGNDSTAVISLQKTI